MTGNKLAFYIITSETSDAALASNSGRRNDREIWGSALAYANTHTGLN